jgi:hypothetical protein
VAASKQWSERVRFEGKSPEGKNEKSRFVRLWRQDSGRFQAANEGFGFANGDFHPDQPVHVGLDPSQLRGQEGDGAAVQLQEGSFRCAWPAPGVFSQYGPGREDGKSG